MLELLEELDPKFKQRFEREVSLNELTKCSLQLSAKTAVVITNRAVYLLAKKWFAISCRKISAGHITSAMYENSKLSFFLPQEQGQITLGVAPQKESILKFGIEKINRFLSTD